MEEKSILIQRKYGAVRLRLAEIMDSRGMTRNQLSRLTGTRYEVVWRQGGKTGSGCFGTDLLCVGM